MKVREASKDMAFTSVHLTLDGEVFQEILEASPGPCGQLSMSFGRRGSVVLGVPMRESSSPLMASFLGVLHEGVQSATFTRELAPAANSAHAA
jgi:hypothetical protein